MGIAGVCRGAFLATLGQHEASLKSAKKRKEARPSASVLERQVERVEETFGDDQRYDAASDEALDAASMLFRDLTTEEASLLKQMRSWAERATAQRDAKAKLLIGWLNETLRPGGKWNDTRVIIFTEYRATQSWLQKLLAAVSSVFYWPAKKRNVDGSKAGILHVKCAVGDGRTLFLSSANLTEYAFTINMELGALFTEGSLPRQVEKLFEGLIANGTLEALE